jgi:hypothetical protein
LFPDVTLAIVSLHVSIWSGAALPQACHGTDINVS